MGSYHAGFLAAGIGMLLGLVIYLLGQPLIRPVPAGIVPEKPASASQLPNSTALTEEQAVAGAVGFRTFHRFHSGYPGCSWGGPDYNRPGVVADKPPKPGDQYRQ